MLLWHDQLVHLCPTREEIREYADASSMQALAFS